MPSKKVTAREMIARDVQARIFSSLGADSVKAATRAGGKLPDKSSAAVAEAMRRILEGPAPAMPGPRHLAPQVEEPIDDQPTIKSSSRRFVQRKPMTFLDSPVGLDGRGRLTQEKADTLPGLTALNEIHDVYMSRCGYCTGMVRRRFMRTRSRVRHDVRSLSDLTLRETNVVKMTPNGELLKMVLGAITRKTASRYKHLVPNRTVAWLDSKPLVILESRNNVLFHEAVKQARRRPQRGHSHERHARALEVRRG